MRKVYLAEDVAGVNIEIQQTSVTSALLGNTSHMISLRIRVTRKEVVKLARLGSMDLLSMSWPPLKNSLQASNHLVASQLQPANLQAAILTRAGTSTDSSILIQLVKPRTQYSPLD